MNAKTKNNATPTAEDAYTTAHLKANELVDQIRGLLGDRLAPENDDHAIHWGHVGSMTEVNTRLAAVVAYLNGTEQ